MATRRLWPGFQAAVTLLFYAGLALGALVFTDHRIGAPGLTKLRQFYALAHLPEQQLGESWSTPALVHGNLLTLSPRISPSGRYSAVWYAWVEEVRGSGRNARTIVLCARHENEDLELRQGDRTARLDLFDEDHQGTLLKDRFLETLRRSEVALDFGPLYHTREIPPLMRQSCFGLVPTHGNLTYYEAHVPIAGPVTVLGCGTADGVQRCSAAGSPPGLVSVRGLHNLLRAYANSDLEGIRGAAIWIGVALSLLASALFKLREVAEGRA